MKALQHKVNIIPIIAKADALTSEELIQMKQIVGINLKKKKF
jgi:septin family protein